ncbi:aldo/keto reductase [Mucilaginibacter humi]|uniref:aldo/keto reductase n=1 Tax=Mucilaginibacter humi TaxID=2732510 RepID=UPI00293BD990|nr:aldo/keto reductase [Mucilaginibacter humi]
MAAQYKTTPASVAIAWVIAGPGITAPIASATSVKQLHDTTQAVHLNLSEKAIALLDEASSY